MPTPVEYTGNDGTALPQSQRDWVGPYGLYTENLTWEIDPVMGNPLGVRKDGTHN